MARERPGRSGRSSSGSRSSSSSRSRSRSASRSASSDDDVSPEQTPLLRRVRSLGRLIAAGFESGEVGGGGVRSRRDATATAAAKRGRGGCAWVLVVAVLALCALVVAILLGDYIIPTAAEVFVREAVVVGRRHGEVLGLSADGVQVRIAADVGLDARRVRSRLLRLLGTAGRSLLGKAQSGRATVHLGLPAYGGPDVFALTVPPLLLPLAAAGSRLTHLEFVSNLTLLQSDTIRRLSQDLLTRPPPAQLDLAAHTRVTIQIGFFRYHLYPLTHAFALPVPREPEYTLDRADLTDAPGGVDLSLRVSLPAAPGSLQAAIPPLLWQIAIPGCEAESRVFLANATVRARTVRSGDGLQLDCSAHVGNFSTNLTTVCPGNSSTPLESAMQAAIGENGSLLYITGHSQRTGIGWLSDLLDGFELPVQTPPVHINTSDYLDSFAIDDLKFALPPLFKPPGTPPATFTVSGKTVLVFVVPPVAENITLSVDEILCDMDLCDDKGEHFGRMRQERWSHALTETYYDKGKNMKVSSVLDAVPVSIVDIAVFERVISKVMGWEGDEEVYIKLDGTCSVRISTPPGQYTLHNLPVAADVPLKALI